MSNIDKPDWETKDSDEQNREAEGVFENPTLGDFNTSRIDKAIKQLYEKVREGIDAINTNTAKTGITTSQANAITANTAKTGITTAQANAITANTAKTGITTTQATQLSNLNAGRASSVATTIKGVTAQITQVVNVNAKTGAATLDSTIVLSNGNRYTLSQTLTKVGK